MPRLRPRSTAAVRLPAATMRLVVVALTFGLPVTAIAGQPVASDSSRPLPPVRPQESFVQFSLPAPGTHEAVPSGAPAAEPAESCLSLEDLQNIALRNNPTLVQASAQVGAAEGQWIQAGLRPNPIIGYQASEMGNEGQSGQQGAFLSQEIMRGRKRQLAQLAASREVAQAQQGFYAQRLRILNDVRSEHFNVLVAQRAMELTQEVASLNQEVLNNSERMFEGKQIAYNDVLQARIQARSTAIAVQNARHRYAASWRRLTSVIGVPQLAPQKLSGALQPPADDLDWDTSIARLFSQSPELTAARINVAQKQAVLERAQVEPMPNVFVQMGIQRDNSTQDTIGNVQIGVPVPLFNANQGNVQTAYADLRNARAEVGRVQLSLRNRLATAFETYANAQNEVEQYSREILPDARKSLDLVLKGYPEQFNIVTLLVAQRTYAQASLAYLQALQQLGVSRVAIEGLMLTGSLREEHAIDVPRVDVGIAPVFGPGRPPVETK